MVAALLGMERELLLAQKRRDDGMPRDWWQEEAWRRRVLCDD
jgi:hypothetical protein